MNEWFDAEVHVERAHEAYEAGRWDDAATELRKALELNPYRAEWHFNLGLTLEAAGRYEEAAKAFESCHELEDDDAQVLLAVGVNFLRADQPARSIEWFERAQRADPSGSASLVHRIEAYARMGDHEQAEVMFYMAQQVNAKDAGAFANLAESLMGRGQTDRAAWCLREAARLDPHMPRIHARLADAYAATGRLERARQLYLRELRTQPGDIDVLLDLGCLLVEMNRLTDAGEKLRRVLEIEPDNAFALFYLSDLAERQGQRDAAIDGFGVVLRLDAEFGGARRRLAALLLERGADSDASQARELLAAEVRSFSASPDLFSVDDVEDLGRILLDAGGFADARMVLDALARRAAPTPAQLHLLAVAMFRSGDRSAGIEVSRRVVELDDKFVPAMHNLAVAHAMEENYTRAGYWIRRALRIDPDDAGMRRLRLKIRLRRALQFLTGRARTRRSAM